MRYNLLMSVVLTENEYFNGVSVSSAILTSTLVLIGSVADLLDSSENIIGLTAAYFVIIPICLFLIFYFSRMVTRKIFHGVPLYRSLWKDRMHR